MIFSTNVRTGRIKACTEVLVVRVAFWVDTAAAKSGQAVTVSPTSCIALVAVPMTCVEKFQK